MLSKPQPMNELQVERVIHLWWKFIEQKYGVIERHDERLNEFIDWLEGGQV